MTRIAIVTFSLFASLASACVGSPEDGAATVATARQVSTQAAPELSQGQSAASDSNLSCPPPGLCAKASALCVDPRSGSSWCAILDRCFDCNGF